MYNMIEETGQDRSGQVRSGQGRAGQGRAGQGREYRTRQDSTEWHYQRSTHIKHMTVESVMPCNWSMRKLGSASVSPDFPILPFVSRSLKIFAGSDIHSNIAHVEELYGIMYVTSVCISAVNEQVTAHH
jgi:hypothetical protein